MDVLTWLLCTWIPELCLTILVVATVLFVLLVIYRDKRETRKHLAQKQAWEQSIIDDQKR